jgi:hypothetical protein
MLSVLPAVNCLTKDEIKIGEKYPIAMEFFGCVDKEQYQKILGYVNDGDQAAYQKALLEALLDGSAIFFEKGQIVKVTDNSIWWDSDIQIRPMGETKEYWTGYLILTG